MYDLKSIKLPSKLKNIPDLAFYGCSSITNIDIPETVTSIGRQAFSGCSKLKTIYIPASVTQISYNDIIAFDHSRLTTIYGHKNSEAEKYANKYKIEFIEVNNKNEINNITTQTTTTFKPTTTSTTTTITTTTTSTLKTTTKPTTTSTTKITTKPSGGNAATTKKTTTTTTTTSASTTTSIDTTTATTTSVPSTTIYTTTTTEPVPPAPHRLDIQGNMTVKEMSLDDIKKAGINVADPSNYHVFEYEVEMAFAAKTYRVIRYEALPQNGTVNPNPNTTVTPQPKIMPTVTVDGEVKHVIGYNVTPKEEMYMIISGECKWLKEFYDVQLIVINKDDQNEMLTDCSAILNIPDGLTLMNCKQIQSLGTLEAGSAFDIHWYVRGDVAGDYNLTAQFIGSNRGQHFTYNFKSENTLHVYAGDALKMTITVPRYSFFDEDYPVKISFKNVSDRPIYNIEHKINEVSQGTYTYKSVNGKTEQVKESIYTDNISAKKELPQLDPGDEIVAEVKIHDVWKSALENGIQDQKILWDVCNLLTNLGENYNYASLAGSIFSSYLNMWVNSITVEHVLQSVKVVTLKDSTVEVPYDVEWENISPELAEKYSKNMLMEHIMFYLNTVNSNRETYPKLNTNRLFYYIYNTPHSSGNNIFYNYYEYLSSEQVAEPYLTLAKDIYYRFNVPDGGEKVKFYIIKDGKRQDAPHSRVFSANEYINDDFDVEVLTGDYTITEDGNIVFSSDAYVKITPKKAGIKATFVAATEDGTERVNIPIEVVDEHECKGEYFILTPPSDGDGAYMASFCSNCHELIECKMLPDKVTAMLSNGEFYDDIRGAIADAEKSEEELKLYIFGDINIVEDVTIPEDLMLVIVPDTMINVNNRCKLIAKGEVKDFSGYDYDLSGNGPISSKITTTSVTTTITTTTTSNSTTTTVVATPTADKRIVGSWYVSHVTIKTDSYDFTDDKGVVIFNNDFTVEAQSKITIGNDGKLHENNEYWTKNGTWSIKGDKYYATPSDIKETEFTYDEATDTISVRLTDAYLVMKRGGKITSTINLGDVNNDSLINAVDASIVLTYYAMMSTNQKGDLNDTQKKAADVDKNGDINAVDASYILSYYAYTSTTQDEIKKTLEEFLK